MKKILDLSKKVKINENPYYGEEEYYDQTAVVDTNVYYDNQ